MLLFVYVSVSTGGSLAFTHIHCVGMGKASKINISSDKGAEASIIAQMISKLREKVETHI